MRLPKRLRGSLALALLAGSLAGCQTALPSQPPVEARPAVTVPDAWLGMARFELAQLNQQQEDPLNLTAQQRQQLERIAQEIQGSDRSGVVQQLLIAPTIDTVALKAQLVQTASEIDLAANAQVRIRNILTPEQRQTIIASLRQAPAQASGVGEDEMQGLSELNLTAEQRQLLTAMNSALRQHDQQHRQQLNQAQIRLLETGDASAYRQALIALNQTLPVDAMVAFFSSLTQAQRQKLFQGSGGGNR